ncbi:MAG: toxin-antitoxin system YwqK family antitoxin [Endomicrobia bacterium]|nr:toxin-antitoxin system YwqK family antitoxin [Bacillota bacterium]MCL1971703.1 toxin-antitoxin system YwqK family antitoxin [Endomicrobiia bacterium]
MIKQIFILSLAAVLFSQSAYAAVTKKKYFAGKEYGYIYYDKDNSEIGREKIVKGNSEFSSGFTVNGEVKEVDDQGILLYVWRYKDNKKHGRAIGFYPGGRKKCEFDYYNGVLKGIGVKYYENGNIAEKVFYIDGKVEGPAHVYLENGNYYKYSYTDNKLNGPAFLYDKAHRLLEAAIYKDNVLEGENIKYYPSGSVKSEMAYSRGKLEGYAKYYDEKGREVSTLLYKNGKVIDKIQHIDEDEASARPAFSKRQGTISIVWQGPAMAHLNESRKMINEIRFFEKGRRLNGVYKTYYKNGQVKYEGKFSNNMPYDDFKTYSPEGKIITIDNYYEGKLTGISIMYYATGEKLAEYRYKNGKLEGISSIYNKDGGLISEAGYQDNLLHGSLKSFYENGQLCFESYFSKGEPVGQLRYYSPSETNRRPLYLIEFKNGKMRKSTTFSEDKFIEFTADY